MKEYAFVSKSVLSTYVALAGIYFVLGTGFAWLQFSKPHSNSWQGSVICFAVVALWVIWIRGFRLAISGDLMSYRDGMYRTRSGSITRISKVVWTWVQWEFLWRKIKVPRLLVGFDDGAKIAINSKPFGRAALREFLCKVDPKSTTDSASSNPLPPK